MKNVSIEERAINLAHYIIDTGDTVRGAAHKFGISKSTVHMDVTQKNGRGYGQAIPESIEIRGVFLSERNPVVKLGIVVRF
jgi:putative DeoR family transcriptional regulator (stage III sporulation protein D)